LGILVYYNFSKLINLSANHHMFTLTENILRDCPSSDSALPLLAFSTVFYVKIIEVTL